VDRTPPRFEEQREQESGSKKPKNSFQKQAAQLIDRKILSAFSITRTFS
jgi:hypothetical protein